MLQHTEIITYEKTLENEHDESSSDFHFFSVLQHAHTPTLVLTLELSM